jgi:signal transduction histidine kinase
MPFDYFLPPDSHDSELKQQVRIVILASWSLAVADATGLAVRLAVGNLSGVTAAIFVGCGAVFVALPWILRATSPRLASQILVGSLVGGLTALAYSAGGIEAPVLLLAPLGPLLAAFLLGFRVGGALAALLCVVVWGFALTRIWELPIPPSGLAGPGLWITQAVALSAVVVLTIVFATLYERQKQEAEQRRRRADEQRRATVVELEGRNAELQRFTRTVTHDLKSPLITVKGFLGLLAKDLANGDEERVRKDMDTLASVADKMQILIEDLLELSRIGQQNAPQAEVDLSELAREAVEMVHGRITERGVEIEIDADLPGFKGDPTLLRLVFQNLVDNAVKFMGAEPRPRIVIGLRRDAEGEVLFVEDNGVGIEPCYQEKVFDLFEKLDATAAGTGIGLASVRRALEVHDGRIWVESEGQGRGCTFCFTLPPMHS